MEKQFHRVGKRKCAIARAYLRPRMTEVGVINVNGRSFEDYFPRESARRMIVQPLEMTTTLGKYDIFVNVRGGGLSGQAGAMRHAIARALLTIDTTSYRAILKKAGHLTRDSREVERKKYGLKKARRAPQWAKR